MKGDLSPFKRAQARDKSEFVPPPVISFQLQLQFMFTSHSGFMLYIGFVCFTNYDNQGRHSPEMVYEDRIGHWIDDDQGCGAR